LAARRVYSVPTSSGNDLCRKYMRVPMSATEGAAPHVPRLGGTPKGVCARSLSSCGTYTFTASSTCFLKAASMYGKVRTAIQPAVPNRCCGNISVSRFLYTSPPLVAISNSSVAFHSSGAPKPPPPKPPPPGPPTLGAPPPAAPAAFCATTPPCAPAPCPVLPRLPAAFAPPGPPWPKPPPPPAPLPWFGVGCACSSAHSLTAATRHCLERASSQPFSAPEAAASDAEAPFWRFPRLVVNAQRSSGAPEKVPSSSCGPSFSEKNLPSVCEATSPRWVYSRSVGSM